MRGRGDLLWEGGSTGSNEDPPPPVVPPEAPPLPPPEELPEESRGEGVLPRMAEAPARLRVEEYQELEDEFIRVAKPEDLRHEDFLMWAAVRDTGLGTCSKCRWGSGCLHCDVRKAWAYACRSTLWHTVSERVRPKAKPKGRPRRLA